MMIFRRKPKPETSSDDNSSIGNASDLTSNSQLDNPQGTISLVLTEQDITGRKKTSKYDKAASSDVAAFLSTLYAILLTLFGFIFPLTEALQDTWLQTWYNGVFLMYIYTVATLFLIYMMAWLMRSSHGTKEEGDDHHYQQQRRVVADGVNFNPSAGMGDSASVASMSINASTDDQNSRSQKAKKISVVSFKSYQQPISMSPDYTSEVGSAKMNSRKVGSSNDVTDINTSKNSTDLVQGNKTTTTPHGGNDRRHKINMLRRKTITTTEAPGGKINFDISVENMKKLFSHEGSSFYLRLGALVFSIGNMIYIILETVYHMNGMASGDCPGYTFGYSYILRFIFTIVQTFFIFKYPKAHVHRQKPFAYFGLAHVIATNLCVWIRTLINEILYEMQHHGPDQHQQLLVTGNETNQTIPDGCDQGLDLLLAASPYLFPFVMEYSLIALGVIAMMYGELGGSHDFGFLRNIRHIINIQKLPRSALHTVSKKVTDGINMAHSEIGLLFGVLMLAGMIASIVVFFFTTGTDSDTAFMIFVISDLIMHSLLLVATLGALYRLRRLSQAYKPASVDDLLLLLTMSSSFLFEMSILIPDAAYLTDHGFVLTVALSLSSSTVAGVQSILQAILTISGLRRYSSSKRNSQEMPGRELLGFLIVGNVTVWIFRTMQVKQLELGVQYDYYGQLAWLLLVNINLPLLLFFRFHSSVCLADIWSIAYKPFYEQLNYEQIENDVEQQEAQQQDAQQQLQQQKQQRPQLQPQQQQNNVSSSNNWNASQDNNANDKLNYTEQDQL